MQIEPTTLKKMQGGVLRGLLGGGGMVKGSPEEVMLEVQGLGVECPRQRASKGQLPEAGASPSIGWRDCQ